MLNSLKLLTLTLVLIPILVQASNNVTLSQRCENAFIGHGYNQSLEKKCRPYWNRFTAEIKKGMPDNH